MFDGIEKKKKRLTRNLEDAIVVHTLEHRIHQGDVFDDEFLLVDGDPVAYIIRMLDEQKDAAGQEFGDCATDGECETSERSPELP